VNEGTICCDLTGTNVVMRWGYLDDQREWVEERKKGRTERGGGESFMGDATIGTMGRCDLDDGPYRQV